MNLLDLLFPPKCVVCGVYSTYLCSYCQNCLKPSLPRCYLCHKLSNNYTTHSQCKAINSYEYQLQSVTHLWDYNEAGSSIISKFKYECVYSMIPTIRSLISARIDTMQLEQLFIDKDTYLIPIPQHKIRTRERGFETTVEIMKIFIDLLKISSNRAILIKRKNNPRQASLAFEKRESNTRDTYKLTDHVAQIPLCAHIILVDDVITSGSTLRAAAKEIRTKRPDLRISGLSLFRAFKK